MGRLIGAICVVAVFIPWGLRSLNDGSVNVNKLIINFAATIQEIITRSPANWDSPKPDAQPKPERKQGV